MHVHRVGGLSEEPLAAAAAFYAEALPAIRAALEREHGDLVIVFEPADHTHRGWRLAAVQQLARDHAPLRVNVITGDDERIIEPALRYLAQAPGVTGQYLPLDGTGAEEVLSSTG
jgi:hypothetical protein